MSEYVKQIIGDGIELICVPANRFKTNEIAIHLAMPLKKETASLNSVLMSVLCRSSKEYPDMMQLNKKLGVLYGASLAPSVSKVGECQLLTIGLTCLDDRFALDDQSISTQCLKLLMSLLFEPRLNDNGLFYDEDILAEKRLLKEKLEAEENEKRTYVLRRTEEEMFCNEAYGVNKYGTHEDIEAITSEDVTQAWKKALQQAKVMVSIVGSAKQEDVEKVVKSYFSKVDRQYSALPKAVFVPKADNVRDFEERIDVKQGKLVLGFRVDLEAEDKLTSAMRSFCDVFGGGPYSKLFANVREKMSLCYYCSARYTRLKSCILVQCGCEEQNMDKAVEAIKNQLSAIQQGDFDDEFTSSKIGLADAILSVNDTPKGIEGWYSSQIIDKEIKTPQMVADENNSVTREEIIHCANLVTLDTVFKLLSTKGDEE